MSKIRKITKRSATSVFRQSSPAANSSALVNALNNLSSDIGDMLTEHSKFMAILNGLAHGSEDSIVGLDSALDSTVVGLDGSVTFTKRASTSSDPEYIFSRSLNRPLTVKESIIEAYTSLKESIDSISIDSSDAISDYTKEYIGEKAFGSSLTSSSTSIDGRLTTLEAEVDAIVVSEVDLDPIKLFIGMTNLDTPTYSSHETVTIVSDGDSLEKAIATLDEAVANLLPAVANGGVVFGDGSTTIRTDNTSFVWNNITKRLGIGNNVPQAALHVTGTILMTTGLQSYGGDSRGSSATDLQTVRTLTTQVASGAGASILGGQNNLVSGNYSGALGDTNIVQGLSSFAVGKSNEITAPYSFTHGSQAKATIAGAHAHANGAFAVAGDAQKQVFVVRRVTTNSATPTELYLDGATAPITLNDESAYNACIHVVGRSATGSSAAYTIRCLIERGAGAGSTALVGSPLVEVLGEDNAAWDATAQADTVAGSLQIMVTGDVASVIRWAATVELTQVSW